MTNSKFDFDIAIGYAVYCILFARGCSPYPMECILAKASGTHYVCVRTMYQNIKILLNPVSESYKNLYKFNVCSPESKECMIHRLFPVDHNWLFKSYSKKRNCSKLGGTCGSTTEDLDKIFFCCQISIPISRFPLRISYCLLSNGTNHYIAIVSKVQELILQDLKTLKHKNIFLRAEVNLYNPPQRLVVLTADGSEAQRVVGPFLEGDSFVLCPGLGGAPPPSVTWWEGDLLLDPTSEVEALDEVTNTLQLEALSRRDLLRSLTCRAANSNLTEPLTATVTINMKLAPLWVRILNTRSSLSAGRPYDIICRSAGARPPAEITWRLDRSKITSHIAKLKHGDNMTTSELRWTPSVHDGGRVLSCHADSPNVQHPPLVDEWLLDVFCECLSSSVLLVGCLLS
nr:uncharacterized protein LOC113829811 [Penaeus vannamei]